jgi:membrane-associated phospholipid phosphatase
VRNYSVLQFTSLLAYISFVYLLFAAVALPCLCGRPDASRRFIVGVLVGTLISIAIFAFVPAIGPWVVEGGQVMYGQNIIANYLVRLKGHVPMEAVLGYSGIICFPSEHVIVALLAGEALAAVRKIRWPSRVFCWTVCVSTITTGWHYGIDVLGGVAAAALVMFVADRICTALEAPTAAEPMLAAAGLNMMPAVEAIKPVSC